MRLLFIVLNNSEYLDELLESFLELGISGATVIDSTGMGRIISRDLPIFAGFKNVFSVAEPSNKTIFTLVEENECDRILDAIEEIIGPFSRKGVGVAFSLPVDNVRGINTDALSL